MRIKKFLAMYPNKSTTGVYRSAVYNFFDCIYGGVRAGKQVTEEEREQYEALAERYFTEGRDYFEDLLTFTATLHNKPPIGAKALIAGVKEFFFFNNVEFSERQRKQLSTKLPRGNHARTAEKDVDVELLRKLLSHMDLKGRAVVLTLASSGMRIGEVVRVKLSDADLSPRPAEIVVRGEYAKTGDTRTVFISSEAQEVILEWLKVRDNYLKAAQNKNRGLVAKGPAKEKAREDDRMFPFSDKNVREMWDNAVKKTGLWSKDSSTGRSQVRVHSLRKFFRSQLALSCPLDITESLMGHEGYLTDAYRRYTRKQMGEYYLKAEHHVTVMGSGDLREIQEKLQDTQMTVDGYRNTMTKQEEEMAELRKDVEALKAREEARTPFDENMTELLKRLIANPELKDILRKEIEAVEDEH